MVDVNDNFVNAAGSAVASGDFETTADTASSSDFYYYNMKAIWAYIKDKSTAPEATFARLAFGFGYCYEAAATGDCTLGSLSSAALTANVDTATEIIFSGAPSAAGKEACKFSVTPSSTAAITITTSGVAPAHMVAAH